MLRRHPTPGRLSLRRLACSLAALLAVAGVPGAAAQPIGAVLFVDADATGTADGSSWADAFPYLQQALAVADAGDEIWVAEGVYRPTDGGPDPDNRTVSFVLADGVGLYGGFDGTEAERDEQDWTAHVTALSGDIGTEGEQDDNSYHVVTANGVGGATVLDGFTVERGRADSDEVPHDRGSGLYAVQSALVVRNTRFYFNATSTGGEQFGGGIYSEDSSLLVEGCLFEENVGVGGGIYAAGGVPIVRRTVFRSNVATGLFLSDGADALIEDVLFEGNVTAGLRIRASSPVVRRTTFRGNTCAQCQGGAVYAQTSGSPDFEGGAPLFEDCLFEGNSATDGGGAVYASGITPAFVRTTFRDNRSTGNSGGAVLLNEATLDAVSPALFLGCRFERNRGTSGGGLFAFGTALAVVNSTFVGNRTTLPETGRGGAVFVNTAPATAPGGGPSIVIANTVVAGNTGRLGGGLLLANVDDADVRLVNTTVAGNEALTAGGGLYTIRAGGLRIENSVLWGNEVPDGAEDGVSLYNSPASIPGLAPSIERSIVEGGCPPQTDGTTTPLDCVDLLATDPLFVRAPGTDGPVDYGDLRLTEGSPGVDAGLAALLPPDRWDLDGDGDTAEPLPLDLAGGPRVVGEAVDLGAYEGAVPVSAEGTPAAGGGLTLSAYPNPSRGRVTLRLGVPEARRVRVGVYDVLGREVAVLHDGPLAADEHRLVLDTARLPSGLYLVRATGDGLSAAQRVTIVR